MTENFVVFIVFYLSRKKSVSFIHVLSTFFKVRVPNYRKVPNNRKVSNYRKVPNFPCNNFISHPIEFIGTLSMKKSCH